MADMRSEWAMWANEHGFVSGIVMLMGGITGVFGFDGFEFAAYTIAAGAFVTLLEYPRSQRRKGSLVPRRFQHILHPIMNCGGPLTKNYYVRFVLYLLMSVPSTFTLPTILGGASLFVGGLIYFRAALGGEDWHVDSAELARQKTLTNRPPANPPPRPPPQGAAKPDDKFTEIPLGNINGQ
ncbi:cytochrome b-245 light chain-like [Acanthaster planci]|uniref:Cytochrome b-245 light chain n=1 Tax=Acanthaster planci TaxID=133434 RepID=A0A8B7XVN5_ACAPL|nr:cytochrome b-245 light chain-like [Acanthaster planci]